MRELHWRGPLQRRDGGPLRDFQRLRLWPRVQRHTRLRDAVLVSRRHAMPELRHRGPRDGGASARHALRLRLSCERVHAQIRVTRYPKMSEAAARARRTLATMSPLRSALQTLWVAAVFVLPLAAACGARTPMGEIMIEETCEAGCADHRVVDARPTSDAPILRDAPPGFDVQPPPIDGGSNTLLDGLVAYWKLDGNALDSSGHGSNLNPSPNQGTLAFVPGKFGQALYPKLGSNYLCPECVALQSANNPYLDFKSNKGDDFTVSLWARRVSSSNGPDGTWWSYAMMGNDQIDLRAQAKSSYPAPAFATLTLFANGAPIGSVSDTTVDFRSNAYTGAWVHVVAYRSGNIMGVVVNGTATTAPISGSVGAAGTFYLAQASNGYPWQGNVDDVAKWNRALTNVEIGTIYNGGVGRPIQ